MKPWPHPSDPPPESRYVIGGCAVMLVLAVAIAVYSTIAPMLS